MKKKITALLAGIFAVVITVIAQNPAVTFTATPTTAICAGSTVTFSNTATGNPTSWKWYFPGAYRPDTLITSAPGNPGAILYLYAGTFYVSCVVTNSSGSDSVTITNCVIVDPLPVATISPPSAGICDNSGGSSFDTIYFTATGTHGNTYSWAPAGGLSCTNCANPRAYPGSNTVYTITVTGTNSCTATYYDTVTVGTIYAKINGQVSSTDTICSGDSLVMIASGGSNSLTTPSSYSWSTGATSSSIVVRPTTTVDYSVTVTSGAAGCSAVANLNVLVFPKPNFTLSKDDSICYPGSTIITATSIGGNFQYSWAGPFGTVHGSADTVSPNITTVYTLVASDIGCHAKDSLITIKVNQKPTVVFSGASNLCQGSSTIITASGGSGGGVTQYHWNTGATTSSINVAPFASTTYTIRVSKGACFTDTTFSIIVDTVPNVKFKGDTSICIGDSTTIYVSGGYTYLWNTGSTADSIFFPSSNVNGQTYYVTVTKGACSKDSDKVTIKLYPHPKPVLYPIDTTVCQYDSVPLTATGGDYFVWGPKNSGLGHYLRYTDTDVNNAAPTVPGLTRYNVNVCTWGCCKDTSLVVNVIPGVANYSVCCNTTVAGGTAVNLSATYSPGPFEVESWAPTSGLSCSDCNNPTATVYTNTTYTVTFLDQGTGCPVTDSVTIDIFNCNIFVPDVFSPDESVNNRLYVRSLCLSSIDFEVFDRFGNRVFETINQNDPWDGTYQGKPMNIGTYMWFLRGVLADGTSIARHGNVTLIR